MLKTQICVDLFTVSTRCAMWQYQDLTPSTQLSVMFFFLYEMGGACSAYGGGERRVQGFWWGNLGERDHWGDPGVDERIILRWGMDWIELAQDRDRWRAVVNVVMDIRVP